MPVGHTAVVSGQDSRDRRRRDLFELSVGYGLILLVIWTPNPWQRLLYWGAAAFILAVSWRSFDGWPAMGLRRTNLLQSLWIVGLGLLGAAVAILIASRLGTLRPWHGPIELVQRFWGYAIWAFLQQFLLQVFFLQRLLRLVTGKMLGDDMAAGIFSFAHLPSPILTGDLGLWPGSLFSLSAISQSLPLGHYPRDPRHLHCDLLPRPGYAQYARRPRLSGIQAKPAPPSPCPPGVLSTSEAIATRWCQPKHG